MDRHRLMLTILNAKLPAALIEASNRSCKPYMFKAVLLNVLAASPDGRPVTHAEIGCRMGVNPHTVNSLMNAWCRTGFCRRVRDSRPCPTRGGLNWGFIYKFDQEKFDALDLFDLPKDNSFRVDSLGIADGMTTEAAIGARDRAIERLKLDVDLVIGSGKRKGATKARTRLVAYWLEHESGICLAQLEHALGLGPNVLNRMRPDRRAAAMRAKRIDNLKRRAAQKAVAA